MASVDTPPMKATAKAASRTRPGSSSSHSARANVASSSSAAMPAAPTTTRWRLSSKAIDADASTYGTGVSISIVTPISWTSPP